MARISAGGGYGHGLAVGKGHAARSLDISRRCVMPDDKRDPSEDPFRSVDQDLPESTNPTPPPGIGPSQAGPVAAAGMSPTGEPVVGAETPSEAQIALEREAKETRAHPRG